MEWLSSPFGSISDNALAVCAFVLACLACALVGGRNSGNSLMRFLYIRRGKNVVWMRRPSGRFGGYWAPMQTLKRVQPLAWLIAAAVLVNAYFLIVDRDVFRDAGASTGDQVRINHLPQITEARSKTSKRTKGLSSASTQVEGRVTHVRDGDTIEVAGKVIRFANLGCAELGTRKGEMAKRRMTSLALGAVVQCRLSGKRSYDRVIGECSLNNGRSISGAMVQEGYCRRWR